MPFVFEKQITPAKKLAVWQITEPFEFFLKNLGLHQDSERPIQRQIEQATSMYLLNLLSGEPLHRQLEKDKFGKPQLLKSQSSVSFSHSKDLVACLYCTQGSAVGVDIEYTRDNIQALSKKFLSARDQTGFEGQMHQQVAWGAKEVLYKIYGIKELNFIQHLKLDFREHQLFGRIEKGDYQAEFKLETTLIDQFVLVWNV